MRSRPAGIIIAIDGPSGAGKSTVARMLSDRLGYIRIDTGAMYRAAAFLLDQSGVNLSDYPTVEKFCSALDIKFEYNGGNQRVIAAGMDVTELIRTPEMSLLTSRVAALKPVREAMLAAQRRMGESGGVVLEGRDIGTVVFPDADVKFYLFASPEVRGRRRFEELAAKGENVSLEETVADVVRRDIQDSGRDIAPLCQAEDAVPVDSSFRTLEEVLDIMENIVRDKICGNGSDI